jgi:hypothetical protein
MGSGINGDERRLLLRGLVENALDIRGDGFMDGWGILVSGLRSGLRASLGVGVDQKNLLSRFFGRNGCMYCQGGFPAAAFLRKKGDCAHMESPVL